MNPILFEIGPIQIPGYGLSLVLSFCLAVYFLRKEGVRFGLDPERLADTAIAALLIGLVGAKALLIFIDLPTYLADPKRLIGTIRSAGVVYGGLIAGALGTIYFLHRFKMPVWKACDVMAPFTALAIGLGRISCILGGCCYGFPYEGPFALHFDAHPLCDAPPNIGLFPVQLVDLAVNVGLFFFLRYRLRHHYRFEGQILATFLMTYGLARGLVEFLRGDDVRGLWLGGLSTSQLISMGVVAAAIFLYWNRKHHGHKLDHKDARR